MRAALALAAGAALLVLGALSLGQGQYRSAPIPIPVAGQAWASLHGGLYYPATLWASGDGRAMYLRCFAAEVYRGGLWLPAGGLQAVRGDTVQVGGGPMAWRGAVNVSGASLMAGCAPIPMPPVDGLRLTAFRLRAPGARLEVSVAGMYVVSRGSLGYLEGAVGLSGVAPAGPTQDDLRVPPEVAQALAPLADSVKAACGNGDAACLLRAIRGLLSSYQYMGTMDSQWPAVPPGADPVVWFLTSGRRGVCIHFASAFVILARLSGIPARLVVGYVSTEPVRQGYVAFAPHAWAEVYLDGAWLQVDPTPAAAGQRAADGAPEPQAPPMDTPDTSAPTEGQQPPQLPDSQPARPQVPWAALLAALAVAAAVAAAARPRYVTLAVGEGLRVGGSVVRVNGRVVGRGPTVLTFDRPGLYVVRAGRLYVVRVVDLRAALARAFVRLLRRAGLPPTATPRELARARPQYGPLAEAAERLLFGPPPPDPGEYRRLLAALR